MSFTCWNAPIVKYNTLEKQRRNSTLDLIAIPTSRHFSDKNHNFNTHAKFILVEQICHVDIDTEKIKERQKQREIFWILTLETLIPKGLNQELN